MMRDDFDVPPEHVRLWTALAAAAPDPLPEDTAQRIRQRLDATMFTLSMRSAHMSRTRWLLAASVAAALLAGGAAGFGIGTARSSTVAVAPTPAEQSPQYLLLLHDTESVERAVAEHGMDAIVAEYADWAAGLAAENRLVDADKLAGDADWIGTDQAESRIGGFFVIRADSREEALAIAETSPHARHGGIVEVRAIEG